MKNALLILIVSLIAQVAACAQLITAFSGGDDLSVGPGTAGFSFTVGSQPETVQALGVWDASGTGLSSAHTVGIWDTTPQHNLLASATVPATGATDINNFWYVPTTPLTLQANTSYVIAAQYADTDLDLAKGNATSVSMTGATYGHALLSTGIGFGFPDFDASAADRGFFGPNASFTAVPEPTATAIVTAGLLAVIAALRRWKARSQPESAVA